MSAYLSEDEQVEAIKKWIRTNGMSVVSGIVLGLVLIFGWRAWQNYQQTHGENASILFSNLENLAAAGKSDEADQVGKALIANYSGSAYATFAALQLAKAYYRRGDKGSAEAELRWAMANAPAKVLKELARLRLARLLLDTGKPDQALQLAQQKSTLMPGDFAEVRGDAAQMKGDLSGARSDYEQARKLGVTNLPALQMKLVALGPVKAALPAGVKQ